MKKAISLLVCKSILVASACAQPLLPSIGIGNLPADTDPVCTIPFYNGNFYTSGKQVGDTMADFTIYDLNGTAFNLATELAKGKPVLLIAGNYTCPVFRKQVPSINNVISTYSTQISTLVYYGVEAHPTDTSPYFGYVNTTTANINAGILYAQPTTYGQRKQLVSDMLNDPAIPLLAPVYIDGPCNNLWSYYGPAPNNSYLIDTNGIIFSKHGWYDKYPDDIICDIDSLLGNPTSCGSGNNNGTFILNVLSADTVWGNPGNTLSINAELVNNSPNNVLVLLRRMANNMAPGCASSMCADVCYSTSTDTVTILIAPGDTQDFHFYFYTSSTGFDTSHARMRFRNVNNANNIYTVNFYGITTNALGISNAVVSRNKVKGFPNPARDRIQVSASFPVKAIDITDIAGKIIISNADPGCDISKLKEGLYFLQVSGKNGEMSSVKFIKTD